MVYYIFGDEIMFNYFLTSSTDAPSSGDEPESVQNFFTNLIETIVNFSKITVLI